MLAMSSWRPLTWRKLVLSAVAAAFVLFLFWPDFHAVAQGKIPFGKILRLGILVFLGVGAVRWHLNYMTVAKEAPELVINVRDKRSISIGLGLIALGFISAVIYLQSSPAALSGTITNFAIYIAVALVPGSVGLGFLLAWAVRRQQAITTFRDIHNRKQP
ncbi:MAG: hypothetical protein J0H61_10710 [Alphaproteobacteria bacterium]|nr:hypothetical protein [Alphaproteobacteria bacterium]